MNSAQFRVHIEAYLNLRSSLGFRTEFESYNLRELADYVEANGFSWPIRTQTILDWIGAAALHCGLPGQRMRLTQARCFLRYLKASVPETEVPGPGLLPRQPRPKPRLYSKRGDHQTPASHLSVVEARFAIATDSLLHHWSARQHGAPRRRSDRSNGRRCSLRLRSSPTLYPQDEVLQVADRAHPFQHRRPVACVLAGTQSGQAAPAFESVLHYRQAAASFLFGAPPNVSAN